MSEGTTVVGIKYEGGVMLAADTLVSYGTLARFRQMERMKAVSNHTAVGGTGVYADFMNMLETLENIETSDYAANDGFKRSPRELWNVVSRILYNRRSEFKPLMIQLAVAGFDGGEGFLGYCDYQGTCYEEEFLATGFGAYIGLPLLRKSYRPNMSREQARAALEEALRVLFYRDARASNVIQITDCTAEGVTVSAPFELETFGWMAGESACVPYQ